MPALSGYLPWWWPALVMPGLVAIAVVLDARKRRRRRKTSGGETTGNTSGSEAAVCPICAKTKHDRKNAPDGCSCLWDKCYYEDYAEAHGRSFEDMVLACYSFGCAHVRMRACACMRM